jgi:hypothetical protein
MKSKRTEREREKKTLKHLLILKFILLLAIRVSSLKEGEEWSRRMSRSKINANLCREKKLNHKKNALIAVKAEKCLT